MARLIAFWLCISCLILVSALACIYHLRWSSEHLECSDETKVLISKLVSDSLRGELESLIERSRLLAHRPLKNWSAMHALLMLNAEERIPNDNGDATDDYWKRILISHPESGPFVVRAGAPWPRTGWDRQSTERHRDQFLHLLSMANAHLDTQIQVNGRSFALLDLLSRSQYEIRQSSELPWSVSAYSYYCPLQSNWKNKYAETVKFASLVRNLADNRDGQCGDTHRLFALARVVSIQGDVMQLEHPDLYNDILEELRENVLIVEKLLGRRGEVSARPWGTRTVSQVAQLDYDSRVVYLNGHTLEWMAMTAQVIHVKPSLLSSISTRLVPSCENECCRLELVSGDFSKDDDWTFGNLCHALSALQLIQMSDLKFRAANKE